jgi:hypothetical protein
MSTCCSPPSSVSFETRRIGRGGNKGKATDLDFDAVVEGGVVDFEASELAKEEGEGERTYASTRIDGGRRGKKVSLLDDEAR